MVIQLTADQENLIESKLQTGQYQSPEEILQIAFRLFEKYEESDAEWLEETRLKIQEAYEEAAPAVDGPAFIRELRQKIRLMLPCPADQWLHEALEPSGIVLFPITAEISYKAAHLTPVHRDPFDRKASR
jgi:Arc/MetJ-type ribon-helix-helix transcriptional regulator